MDFKVAGTRTGITSIQVITIIQVITNIEIITSIQVINFLCTKTIACSDGCDNSSVVVYVKTNQSQTKS